MFCQGKMNPEAWTLDSLGDLFAVIWGEVMQCLLVSCPSCSFLVVVSDLGEDLQGICSAQGCQGTSLQVAQETTRWSTPMWNSTYFHTMVSPSKQAGDR